MLDDVGATLHVSDSAPSDPQPAPACMLSPHLEGQGWGCARLHTNTLGAVQSLKQKEAIVAELAAANKAIESSSNRGAKLLIRCSSACTRVFVHMVLASSGHHGSSKAITQGVQ